MAQGLFFWLFSLAVPDRGGFRVRSHITTFIGFWVQAWSKPGVLNYDILLGASCVMICVVPSPNPFPSGFAEAMPDKEGEETRDWRYAAPSKWPSDSMSISWFQLWSAVWAGFP